MKRYLVLVYTNFFELEGSYQDEADRFGKAKKIANDLNEQLVTILWLNVHKDLSINMGTYIYEDLEDL